MMPQQSIQQEIILLPSLHHSFPRRCNLIFEESPIDFQSIPKNSHLGKAPQNIISLSGRESEVPSIQEMHTFIGQHLPILKEAWGYSITLVQHVDNERNTIVVYIDPRRKGKEENTLQKVAMDDYGVMLRLLLLLAIDLLVEQFLYVGIGSALVHPIMASVH